VAVRIRRRKEGEKERKRKKRKKKKRKMKRKKKIEEKNIRVFWTFDIFFTTRRSRFVKCFRTNKPEPEKTVFPYEPEPELFFTSQSRAKRALIIYKNLGYLPCAASLQTHHPMRFKHL